MNIITKKKREREREKSDHPEQSAGKYSRLSLDATPLVLPPPPIDHQSIDERFKHHAAGDVDAIDLPCFTKEDVASMSSDELDTHFLAAPLKGIEVSDHLT